MFFDDKMTVTFFLDVGFEIPNKFVIGYALVGFFSAFLR